MTVLIVGSVSEHGASSTLILLEFPQEIAVIVIKEITRNRIFLFIRGIWVPPHNALFYWDV